MGCADWRWVSLDDVSHFAFSVADHQVIAALRAWYENNQVLPTGPSGQSLRSMEQRMMQSVRRVTGELLLHGPRG